MLVMSSKVMCSRTLKNWSTDFLGNEKNHALRNKILIHALKQILQMLESKNFKVWA